MTTRTEQKKKVILKKGCEKILELTCVTIETTEQHSPPRNAVMNIVRTEPANTVNIHDNENGADIIVNKRRRP